jgi:acyl-CoA synthetase (NDP forming)
MGLSVPALSPDIRSQLEKWTPADAGSSVANPVEIGLGREGLSEHYAESLKLVASDPNIDMILTMLNVHLYTQFGVRGKQVQKTIEALIDAARDLNKPMAVVMPFGDSIETIAPVMEAHEKAIEKGLAIFSDMGTAIKAISKVVQYCEFAQH